MGSKLFRNALIINSGKYDTIPGGTAMKTLESFSKEMMKYGLNPGQVEKPCTVNVADVLLRFPPANAMAVIQQIILAGIKRSFEQKPKFLLVLLPNQNALLYDSIKTLLDCELGVPSQFCVGSKFAKTSDQYFANVAMKINQKLGGVNHTVDIKRMAPLDVHTIIFGVDVTHPSPGSAETAPSIAGVVASIDAMFSQYPASMRCQEGRKEMVVELEAMIVERLQLWQRRNQRRLPQKVIVYRDGVGESQYSTVIEVEGAAFKSAFDRLYGAASKHPKISIIMVGKRHHTRFYPTSLGDTDGSTGTQTFPTTPETNTDMVPT
jgi:eukaryotic translation initiation factor 2C